MWTGLCSQGSQISQRITGFWCLELFIYLINIYDPATGTIFGQEQGVFWSYVPLESGRNVFAQPPMPRTAMEQSGHAQVPTLLVALVRRQAGRAGWRAEIAYKNREDWKFQKEKRHQFEGFAFHNIFKGCLYLFIRQHGFFKNTREHKNCISL